MYSSNRLPSLHKALFSYSVSESTGVEEWVISFRKVWSLVAAESISNLSDVTIY
jgi:hypothetical protein